MKCTVDSFGGSDIGRKRSENQDQFLIADLEKAVHTRQTTLPRGGNAYAYSEPKGQLFVVADGMGGHSAGTRASELAVHGIVRFVADGLNWPEFEGNHSTLSNSEFKIDHALDIAQNLIVSESRQHPDRHGMGTTATLALVYWPHLYLAHVGDSGCYLFRDGALQKLTTDHTLASLVAKTNPGVDADAEATLQSNVGHIIYNALGGVHADFEPEIAHIGLQSGDVILLCSDGLTRHVRPKEIAAELAQGNAAAHSVNELIDSANARGGHDNTTVVIARFIANEQEGPKRHKSTVVTMDASPGQNSVQPSLGMAGG
jgi:serine/threonine protein phosphatase PrpC